MLLSEFERLMNCGHGRCAKILETKGAENYKEILLKGCLNNLSYDVQVEGFRGIYMYNLLNYVEDEKYFVDQAIKKFLSAEINADWKTIGHLSDFFSCYYNDGHKKMLNLLKNKYNELYSHLMIMRKSKKQIEIRKGFEYVAIVIMQLTEQDELLSIIKDMGAYFLKRRKDGLLRLSHEFSWFAFCIKDKYGEKFISDLLKEKSADAEEIYKFYQVTSYEHKKERRRLSIEDFIESVYNEKADFYGFMDMRRLNEQGKMILATKIIEEKDIYKKAHLLEHTAKVFQPFPLGVEPLLDYARAEDVILQKAALKALQDVREVCVRELAVEFLKSEKHISYALQMLITNYHEEDKDLLMNHLEKMEICYDNRSEWHEVVTALCTGAEEGKLPDEVLTFIYEKSLCSFCRESALREMKKRNILTEEMIEECKYDSDYDIRNMMNEE